MSTASQVPLSLYALYHTGIISANTPLSSGLAWEELEPELQLAMVKDAVLFRWGDEEVSLSLCSL